MLTLAGDEAVRDDLALAAATSAARFTKERFIDGLSEAYRGALEAS